MSPPGGGGGGGRGHQPGRDAAVAGGAEPCPVPLPTPSVRVWPRWGAGTRGEDTLLAGGTPPGRAKQAGTGGTRSMLGARGGHVPAWRRWETRGCGGTSPVLGGAGRGTHMATQAPRPPAGALSPPRCSSREPCPYLGVPTALLPLPVSLLRRGDCGGCSCPPAGGWGEGWSPKGRVRSRDPRWLRARGAGWGPGTPTGSASQEPSAGGWVTVGLGQSPRGSGCIGGSRGVAGAQVGPAKRSA